VIVAILNIHGYPRVVLDTIDSIRTHMTNNILLVSDGAAWENLSKISWGTIIVKGFYHNYNRSPYKNVILGFKEATEKWEKADWYVYIEYDCLVVSDSFLSDLDSSWCLANDYRDKSHRFTSYCLPVLNEITGVSIDCSQYVLGCCVFYSGKFIRTLRNTDFFSKFIKRTAEFEKGWFPDYKGYAFEETLLPSLVTHFGGTIKQLAAWKGSADKILHPDMSRWNGRGDKYPMRFRPEIQPSEVHPNATIIHPVKEYNSPIREHYRETRTRIKKFRGTQ
jgi:hypothetical protein